MKSFSPVSVLKKVCKLGNLHYRFFKNCYGYKMLFCAYDKRLSSINVNVKHTKLQEWIAAPTYVVPDEIEGRDDAAYWALFNTSLLRDVFGHVILSYEQLLVELEIRDVWQ